MFIHIIDISEKPVALIEGLESTIDRSKVNSCRIANILILLSDADISSYVNEEVSTNTTVIEMETNDNVVEVSRYYHRYVGKEPDSNPKPNLNDMKERISRPFAQWRGMPDAFTSKDCADLHRYFTNLLQPWVKVKEPEKKKEGAILTWYPNEGQSVVYDNIEKVNHMEDGADITFKDGKGISLHGGSYSLV